MNKIKGLYYIIDALMPVIIVACLIVIYGVYVQNIKKEYDNVTELVGEVKKDGEALLGTLDDAKMDVEYQFCQLENTIAPLKNSINSIKGFTQNVCAGGGKAKKVKTKECIKPDKQAQHPIQPAQFYYAVHDIQTENYLIKTNLLKDVGDWGGKALRNTGSVIGGAGDAIFKGGEKVVKGVGKGVKDITNKICNTVSVPFKFVSNELKKVMMPFTHIEKVLARIGKLNLGVEKQYKVIHAKTTNAMDRVAGLLLALIDIFNYLFWLIFGLSVWYFAKYLFTITGKIEKGIALLRR